MPVGSDLIEIIRRQLVCRENGVEIPVDRATGKVDYNQLYTLDFAAAGPWREVAA